MKVRTAFLSPSSATRRKPAFRRSPFLPRENGTQTSATGTVSQLLKDWLARRPRRLDARYRLIVRLPHEPVAAPLAASMSTFRSHQIVSSLEDDPTISPELRQKQMGTPYPRCRTLWAAARPELIHVRYFVACLDDPNCMPPQTCSDRTSSENAMSWRGIGEAGQAPAWPRPPRLRRGITRDMILLPLYHPVSFRQQQQHRNRPDSSAYPSFGAPRAPAAER